MVAPSVGTTAVFLLIVALVVVALLAGVVRSDRSVGGTRLAPRVAAGAVTWLGLTGLASGSGVLAAQTLPPPMLLFFASSMAVALWFSLSRVGARLATAVPIAALVGAQGFRLPLELVLHRWYVQGVLPVQMTYDGHNFDIVTGVLALLVGAWLWRGSPSPALARKVVLAFNVVGLALLTAVGTIAVLSAPLPIRQYTNDPPVLLALYFPYGWIVPFCVAPALAGHVIVLRWLASEPPADGGLNQPASHHTSPRS